VSSFFTLQVRRSDVLSAWSGIRPLASDPNADDTASISRDHIITTDPSGLVTVSGGKWTTYRIMAQEAVDEALKSGAVTPTAPSSTEQLQLVGTPGWDRAYHAKIAQNYVVPHRQGAIDTRVGALLKINSDDFDVLCVWTEFECNFLIWGWHFCAMGRWRSTCRMLMVTAR
jgi:glycerol-3-phosphate dehydrogenase